MRTARRDANPDERFGRGCFGKLRFRAMNPNLKRRALERGLVLGGALCVLLAGHQACAENLYLDPDWIRAMIRVEAEYNQAAYDSDPMQVNNPADWSALKREAGLTKGAPPGQELSIQAGLKCLKAHAFQVDANGERVRFLGWQEAIRRYNGGGDAQYLEKVEKAYQDIKSGR